MPLSQLPPPFMLTPLDLYLLQMTTGHTLDLLDKLYLCIGQRVRDRATEMDSFPQEGRAPARIPPTYSYQLTHLVQEQNRNVCGRLSGGALHVYLG